VTQAKIVEEKLGARTEVPKRVAPAAALAAVHVNDKLLYSPEGNNLARNQKPWREGGGMASWMPWIYMTAFGYSPKNELVQGFAEAFTLSEDGKTYTFHLNPDAVFTDGSPITADAVKWAYEFGLRPEDQVGWGGSTLDLKIIEGADSAIAGETEDVSGLVVVDDNTLEFNILFNTPSFPYRMGVWLQGIFKAEAAEEDPDFFLNPIGAGPYTISHDLDNSQFVMTATDNYWEDPPIVKEIVGTAIADNQTKLIMFENGDLDFIFASPRQQPAILDTSHPLNQYVIRMPYAGLVGYTRFNTARPPFDDINVRKALMHALDHDNIIGAIFGTKDHRGLSVLVPEINCHDPAYKGYQFDAELAKQYLAQSKYGSGANLPSPSVIARPGSGLRITLYEAWQAAWKDVLDVDFKIHLVERGGEVPADINMLADSWGAYVPDPGFLLDLIVHTKTAGVMHVNDSLDAKLDAANQLALDDAGRCAAFREVDQEFMNGYYIIPSVRLNYNYVVNPWVFGLEPSVQGTIPTLPFLKVGERP
jgi:ABC-type transport system substrate-binding protein